MGTNIPAHLHQEHLHRACKETRKGLGEYTIPNATQRVGKCIGPLTKLCHAFDGSTGIPPISTAHSTAVVSKYMKKMVEEISTKSSVFTEKHGHKDGAFSTFEGTLMDKISRDILSAGWNKNDKMYIFVTVHGKRAHVKHEFFRDF